MHQVLTKIWNQDFLRHNITLFLSSMVLAVINYAYHPVLGRLLTVEEYGEAQTLISLFLNLGILAAVFMAVMNNVSAKYRETNPGCILFFIKHFSAMSLRLGILVTLVLFLLSPYVQQFFHIRNIEPLWILSAVGLTLFSNSIYRGVLQGLHDFSGWSLNQILVASSKLFVAIALVLLGFSVSGAIMAFFVSELLGLIAARRRALNNSVFADAKINEKFDETKSVLMEYGLQIFLGSMGMMLLFTSDIFIVKRLFSETEAGLYSGIAAIAKIVFFVSGSVVTVLFPLSSGKKQKQIISLFLSSIGLVLLLGGSVTLVFTLFPEQIVSLLIGDKYLAYAHFLPKMSLILLAYTSMRACHALLLAQRDKTNLLVIGITLVSIFVSTYVLDNSIENIVNIFLYSFTFANVLFFIYVLARYRASSHF